MKVFEVHMVGFEMAHIFPTKGLEKCVFAFLGQLQMNFSLGKLPPEEAKHYIRDPELRKYIFANEHTAVRLLERAKKAERIRFVVTLTRPKEQLEKPSYVLQILSVSHAGVGTLRESTATIILETINFTS